MKRQRASTAIAAGLAAAFSLAAAAAPIRVACTTTLVADVVRAVAFPGTPVVSLVPVGVDPHTFQPTPDDVRAVADADLVFLSGAGLEADLASVVSTARGPRVDLSADLSLRKSSEGDEHGAVDPHVWFDPWNVAEWVRRIAVALAAADPEGATRVSERAAAYLAELDALDVWIRATVAELAPESRLLVTDHRFLGYFAARYGFTELGAIFPGTSTLAEPSTRDLARLEDSMRTAGVRAVFVGTTVSSDLALQVAADTGARVVFLYTGSLGESDGPAATYLDLMRFDVRAIVDALAGRGGP